MKKIGFYFPTQNFTQFELKRWLPELETLNAGWLVIPAPTKRAIPEPFIRGLIEAGVTPVLHFKFSPNELPNTQDLHLLFETYVRWGVSYCMLFDRPNSRENWSANGWAQSDLVERFLDIYAPLANLGLNAGLTPIFPPLEPGGDYWDTIFLRSALEGLQRRGQRALLEKLALAAYTHGLDRPLNWGLGGPERWPDARPYQSSGLEEDQRGFRIFDWYLTISQAALGSTRPIFLFGLTSSIPEPLTRNQQILSMGKLLAGEPIPEVNPLPEEVIAGIFSWQPIPGDTDSPSEGIQAKNGAPNMGAPNMEAPNMGGQNGAPSLRDLFYQWVGKHPKNGGQPQGQYPCIDHYLLLPTFEWGIADFHLEAIRPYVKKYQPTVGFSLREAKYAQRVTVIGNDSCFSESTLGELRAAGCIVERISEDGTQLATRLAAL